jgi:hypothetical protein
LLKPDSTARTFLAIEDNAEAAAFSRTWPDVSS